jgi:hypothetical protein
MFRLFPFPRRVALRADRDISIHQAIRASGIEGNL